MRRLNPALTPPARRLVLISSIYQVFLVIAPLSALFGWLYFLPAYPLYSHILLRVLGTPPVDTAGAVWEEAIRFQTIGLLVSQFLLFGVAALKESITTSVLSLLSFVLVWVRTSQLEAKFVPHGKHMPLQRCKQLDAIGGGDASLSAYSL